MKGIAEVLRGVPRAMLIFSAAHALLGFFVLVGLAFSRCVDTPCPPGMFCFDGCQVLRTPWSDGTWPIVLAVLLAFTVSSVLLLGGSRSARWVLLVALIAYWMYVVCIGLDNIRLGLESDMTPGVQRGWGAVWEELVRIASPQFWLLPLGWVALDAWLLFSARFKRHFRVVA
jgi:hypothetical protein